MNIEIEPSSGFCFGVVNAIKKAEKTLNENPKKQLYSLGDIVHNEVEVDRLEQKGLATMSPKDLQNHTSQTVLIRAHGEPPATYQLAKQNNINIIDATCPVVLKLQKRIRKAYEATKEQGGQIIIYGKAGHAEVNGLVGQTENEAIVIKSSADFDKIDFTRPITLFSQTTMSIDGFFEIIRQIEQLAKNDFTYQDTVCRQVSNREPKLKQFAKKHDIIIFVGGKKSSNAKVLFQVCKDENPCSYFISDEKDLCADWFSGVNNIGISGATSTPMWLMENVKNAIEKRFSSASQ